VDKGLKLFLDAREVEQVQEFEEERVADLMRIQLNENLRDKIEKRKDEHYFNVSAKPINTKNKLLRSNVSMGCAPR